VFVTRLRRGQVLKARPVYSTHVKACAGLTKEKEKETSCEEIPDQFKVIR